MTILELLGYIVLVMLLLIIIRRLTVILIQLEIISRDVDYIRDDTSLMTADQRNAFLMSEVQSYVDREATLEQMLAVIKDKETDYDDRTRKALLAQARFLYSICSEERKNKKTK